MTAVMGIVNVTPDSFSDGGAYFSPEEAVRRVHNIAAEGAAIIDIGAESTRPGAVPVRWEEEWSRLEPVLARLGRDPVEPRISVDTYHPETARMAIGSGVGIVNCVYEEPVPEMLALLREFPGVELVMPAACLHQIQEDAATASRVYIDPMIGFGTTREEDIALLRSVPELAKKGRVVVGASRKRIVKKLTGEESPGMNLGGSLGIAVWSALNGASVVRVHDVRETVHALKAAAAIAGIP